MKKIILITCMLLSGFAQANLLIVDSNEDVIQVDNNCTLREAITAANFNITVDKCGTGSGDDLIWVLLGTSGDAIILNNQLGIIDGVEIQGPGADNLVLAPANGHTGHIFQINTDRDVTLKDLRIGGAQSSAIDVVEVGNLTIENMKIVNNSAGNNENGGALVVDTPVGIDFSENRTVSILNSELNGNQAIKGGAIYIDENYLLNVEDSIFQNNLLIDVQGSASNGSAISKKTDDLNFASRDLDIIVNSQFINNGMLGSDESALYFFRQKYSIDSSVFIDNHDTPIATYSGLGSISNSLFSGNFTNYAVLSSNDIGELTIKFSTFVDNSAAIGASNSATVYIEGNIFDTDGCDETVTANPGTIISLGYNIEYNNASFVSCTSEPSDFPNSDPMLLPVGTYGGTIPIAPISPLSPAVDAALGCDTNDLSGEGRSRDGDADGMDACDVGAVERPDAYNLNVDNIGNGDGHVYMLEFDMSCYSPDDCDWPLEQGLTYLLEPVADTGSQFVQWGGACSGNSNCLVTMNGAKNVTAEFALVNNPVTLTLNTIRTESYLDATVTSNPLGISCGATCSFDFDENETVVLTANPQSDTVVDSWDNCHEESMDGLSCTIHLGSMNEQVDIYLDKNPDIIFKSTFE